MATIALNSYPSEFNFINNPIVVGVENMSFPDDSTFRQIIIEVTVTPTFSGATPSVYNFRLDASAGGTLWADISTALRAAMCGWTPTPSLIPDFTSSFTNRYPYASFTTKIWEEYLWEGDVYTNDYIEKEIAYAYYGGLSEYDRLCIQAHPADYIKGMSLSSKPAQGELFGNGDYKITTTVVEELGILRTLYEVTSVQDGFLPKGLYHHFMFINSFGVLETCSAWCREALSYDIKSEKKSLVTTPSFHPSPNLTARKTGNRPLLEMSSGPVSEEWADWWTTEFLMSEKYWVKKGTVKKPSFTTGQVIWREYPLWLPCVVTASDDTVPIYNRAEQSLPHVDFDVEVAVSGSVINGIRLT